MLKAIDFFCGAGGMTYGLARAGIKVLAGIDSDPLCGPTYERNNQGSRFMEYDIRTLKPQELAHDLKLRRNDDRLILVGCTPCQFWSKINTDRKRTKKSAFLLAEFERFVDWLRPGFVVIENVPGLKAKSKTMLPEFERFLKARDYAIAQDIVNANFYGVPQNRKRFLLIACRTVEELTLPKARCNRKLIVRRFIGRNNGFKQISAGTRDSTEFIHSAARLSEKNLTRISLTTKNGGTRKSWKTIPQLQIKAYKGKDSIFRDVYGRMYWSRPAPTITTRFNSISNGRFGHPSQNRAISLREGATLQTFPKSYVFLATDQNSIARHIGNAVPPAMATRIGRHLISISANG